MRISWFTPLPSEDNDPELPISLRLYLQHLLPTLRNHVDLTVFTKQQRWETWIDDLVTVKPITASDNFWSEVHRGQLAVYHLADYPRTFAEFFDLSRTQPGLVVLHDTTIHSLVAFIWARFRKQPRTYLEILKRYAGEQHVEAGRQWLKEGLPPGQAPADAPLLEYLLESALAAIAHEPSVGSQLEASARMPTQLIPLPFAVEPNPNLPAKAAPNSESRSLVLFGEPELSLFPVLETLVLHPVRPHLDLAIFAPKAQRRNVQAALQELGLTHQSQLFHDPEDPGLKRRIHNADLVVDYRRAPEQELYYRLFSFWQSATPTSAPLPPSHPLCRQGLVLGIRPDHALEDFSRHLNLLHGSMDSLFELGQRVQKHLRTAHHPDRYVESLLEIADQAVDQNTPAACRRFAHRMSTRLEWLPDAERGPIQSRVASFLDRLSLQSPPSRRRRSPAMSRYESTQPPATAADQLRELRQSLAAERKAREQADARLRALESQVAEFAEGNPQGRAAGSPDLDRYYLAFENRFRGSSEEIKKRLEVYGPQILETAACFPGGLCLDLGCGRGEWLEILSARGLRAVGIDRNTAMVEACRELGFEAALGDGLELLADYEDGSIALFTGFHIIEHLPSFESLAALVQEAMRVLMPGGLVIFESPNPENLTVGACSFYLDHTHRKPLHPESVGLLLQTTGFIENKILRLVHGRASEPPFEMPSPEAPMSDELGKVFRLINNHLLSAPDYAVVGRKPLDEA